MCFTLLVDYLFSPESLEKVPWEFVFNKSPILSAILALIFIAILIFGGSQLLKIFWNRFISDISKVREISFQEAMAIFLIIGVLFS